VDAGTDAGLARALARRCRRAHRRRGRGKDNDEVPAGTLAGIRRDTGIEELR